MGIWFYGLENLAIFSKFETKATLQIYYWGVDVSKTDNFDFLWDQPDIWATRNQLFPLCRLVAEKNGWNSGSVQKIRRRVASRPFANGELKHRHAFVIEQLRSGLDSANALSMPCGEKNFNKDAMFDQTYVTAFKMDRNYFLSLGWQRREDLCSGIWTWAARNKADEVMRLWSLKFRSVARPETQTVKRETVTDIFHRLH